MVEMNRKSLLRIAFIGMFAAGSFGLTACEQQSAEQPQDAVNESVQPEESGPAQELGESIDKTQKGVEQLGEDLEETGEQAEESAEEAQEDM